MLFLLKNKTFLYEYTGGERLLFLLPFISLRLSYKMKLVKIVTEGNTVDDLLNFSFKL